MKYYAKQIAPEYQEDDLFYRWTDENKHSHLGMNDDYLAETVIIVGNKEFMEFTNKAYDKLAKFANDLWYDWDYLESCGFHTRSEFLEYYYGVSVKNKRLVHQWIELFNNWSGSEDDYVTGLKLLTGHVWRSVTIRGCMQSEWQDMYVRDDVSDRDVRYVEMCYFNTGMEFVVYESKEDFDNDVDGCSCYVEDIDDLCQRFMGNIHVFEFTGYKKIPEYKEVADC